MNRHECPLCGNPVDDDDYDDDGYEALMPNPRGKLPSATVSAAAKRLVAKLPGNNVKGPARLRAFQAWARLVAENDSMPANVRALAERCARDKNKIDDLANVVYALSYGDWYVR